VEYTPRLLVPFLPVLTAIYLSEMNKGREESVLLPGLVSCFDG
jgi:hypothetical protein